MKIFGYSENAAPTKLTGRSFRQASDTRKEENHANSKKSCSDASRSASAVSFIYRGTVFRNDGMATIPAAGHMIRPGQDYAGTLP
jgi:hypothetical protein